MKRFLTLTLICIVLAAFALFLPKATHASGAASNSFFGITAISEDDAWATGEFITNSGTQTLIEHWDGSSWQVVPSPNPAGSQFSGQLGITAIGHRDVWTVGSFIPQGGGNGQTLIEHWNGTQWQIVPSPNPAGAISSFLNGAAAVSKDNVWAAGVSEDSTGVLHTLIEHWDGSAWSIVSSPTPGPQSNFLQGVTAVAKDDVWAVGDFVDSTNTLQTLIEHWNGHFWEVVPSATPVSGVLNGVTATSENNAWAVGHLIDSNGFEQPLTEHWDGSTWQVVPSSAPAGSQFSNLSGVSAIGSRDVWAVGDFVDSSHLEHTLTEHWDGNAWTIISSPEPPGSTETGLNAVSAIFHHQNVWAAGVSFDQSNSSSTLVEHWNGHLWQVVSSPTP